MPDIKDYIGQIRKYITCLSNQDYQTAQRLTLLDSLPIQNIKYRIEEYGTNLVPLPNNAFDLAEVYQISAEQIDVYIPLWSKEEGRSDLTLCLSCFENENRIKINDLEVL